MPDPISIKIIIDVLILGALASYIAYRRSQSDDYDSDYDESWW